MKKKSSITHILQEYLPDAQSIEFREPPHANRVVLYFLLSFLVVIALWATYSKIDKIVVARGRLITPIANLVVQPLEPSILKSINVRVGQVVKKGTVLATLDNTFVKADAGQIISRRDKFDIQSLRLEAELDGRTEIAGNTSSAMLKLQSEILLERQAAYNARNLQFEETIEALKASLLTNQQKIKILKKRLLVVQEHENIKVELVEKKIHSRDDLLTVKDKRLAVEQEYQQALNKETELKRQIAASKAERESYKKSLRKEIMEELAESLQKRDELNDQLSKATLRSSLVSLTAPMDSIVLEIAKLSVGSVVRDAEAMFELVPVGVELEAEVEVNPADVGHIRKGDEARIKIDAYPFQKHGTMKGTILNMSADTFSRKSVRGGGDEYYYLARISLDQIQLDGLPQPTLLLPGMTLTGEIKTGERSVISFFLYPVIRAFDESLRER